MRNEKWNVEKMRDEKCNILQEMKYFTNKEVDMYQGAVSQLNMNLILNIKDIYLVTDNGNMIILSSSVESSFGLWRRNDHNRSIDHNARYFDVQATYENPPHVYALADNMYRNMTIGLRSMMIGMTYIYDHDN